MEPIKILYDYQHDHKGEAAQEAAAYLNQREGLEIRLKTCDPISFREIFSADPNQHFIFLHLGTGGGAGACREADRCREISNTILVADSSIFPENRFEILQHFDEYVHAITPPILKNLLEKYGFLG